MAQGQSQFSQPAYQALSTEHMPASYLTWPGVLDRLGRSEELAEAQVTWAMEQIMQGEASDAQIAAFAFGLQVKGITSSELASAAQAMRSFSAPLDLSSMGSAVDIVGTGGDGAHTVNISTMVALTLSAMGVPVAKHGNRAASSKSGGADMLEALGVTIDLPTEKLEHAAQETGFAFMFAKKFHPALRFAAPVRSELATPTLFNLLGPLTNPAHPRTGLIGCAFRDMMPVIAGAFAAQGHRVLVARGLDGLDEISVTAPTEIIAVDTDGTVSEHLINPLNFGVDLYLPEELTGYDAQYNAQVALDLFSGSSTPAIRAAVVLNTAAALASFYGWEEKGLEDSIREYIPRVQEALDSGVVAQKVKDIISAYSV